MKNQMCVEFDSKSENEAFARVTVAAFLTQLNPTLEEVDDVKMVVSEAVTNAIVHGYEQRTDESVFVECSLDENVLHISIMDHGVGIENIKQAMEPMYTTKPDQHRSGMGFTFMETLMDKVEVESVPGKGTKVTMIKRIGC